MENKFDVCILGSGPGGYVAAIYAAKSGLNVCLVEKDKELGGTCLNRGCIPTKSLLYQSGIYQKMKKSENYGVSCSDLKLDFAKVQENKNRIVKKIGKGIEFLMNKNKVVVYKGFGKLNGKDKVIVEGEEIVADNIIIATGSSPKMLPNINKAKCITSDEALSLEKLPESITIIGAGAIGIEFAEIFYNYGVRVTVFEALPRILPFCDQEISAEFSKILKRRGIDVFVNVKDAAKEIKSELTLVSIGRKPALENLGLDESGIEKEKGFVKVNEKYQTSVPNIYAIGDIVNTPQLAHLASHEGMLAIDHICKKNSHKINYDFVPNCIYTEPEIAVVGKTEKEAIKAGYNVKTSKVPLASIGKASVLGAREGFVKIVSEENNNKILGIHVMAPHATELIGEAVSLLNFDVPMEELNKIIHPHPTLSELYGEAGLAFFGREIHL